METGHLFWCVPGLVLCAGHLALCWAKVQGQDPRASRLCCVSTWKGWEVVEVLKPQVPGSFQIGGIRTHGPHGSSAGVAVGLQIEGLPCLASGHGIGCGVAGVFLEQNVAPKPSVIEVFQGVRVTPIWYLQSALGLICLHWEFGRGLSLGSPSCGPFIVASTRKLALRRS